MPPAKTPNIRSIISPYIKFRAFIKHTDGNHRHYYGRETNTTVQQVLYKIVTVIELDRLAGWHDLVTMIEDPGGYAYGKYSTATIYSRAAPSAPFHKLHRHYVAGRLDIKSQDDPVITQDLQYYKLHTIVQNNRIELLTDADYQKMVRDFKLKNFQ